MNPRGSKDKSSSANKNRFAGKRWHLAEICDGYTKERRRLPELAYSREFIFEDNGTFRENHSDKTCYEGSWELSTNRKELTLQYSMGRTDSRTLRIRELSDGRLKLTWAGRCGAIIETYRAATGQMNTTMIARDVVRVVNRSSPIPQALAQSRRRKVGILE
jgi:lipocalin-like protein